VANRNSGCTARARRTISSMRTSTCTRCEGRLQVRAWQFARE
jgi:hypothetical protein